MPMVMIESLSCVELFETPWTVACQVPLPTPIVNTVLGLPWWLSGKESICQCTRRRFNPWVGKIPWRNHGNPLQYSCLGNPMERRACHSTVHMFTKGWTWLCDWIHMHAWKHLILWSKQATLNSKPYKTLRTKTKPSIHLWGWNLYAKTQAVPASGLSDGGQMQRRGGLTRTDTEHPNLQRSIRLPSDTLLWNTLKLQITERVSGDKLTKTVYESNRMSH